MATGLVWIGQGTALIKSSSFMTGDPFWAWTGLAAVVVGIGLIAWAMRASRRADREDAGRLSPPGERDPRDRVVVGI